CHRKYKWQLLMPVTHTYHREMKSESPTNSVSFLKVIEWDLSGSATPKIVSKNRLCGALHVCCIHRPSGWSGLNGCRDGGGGANVTAFVNHPSALNPCRRSDIFQVRPSSPAGALDMCIFSYYIDL